MEISKSTFNGITKCDLKWHLCKMHIKKERKKCGEGCKSVYKEMEDISKEKEISREH